MMISTYICLYICFRSHLGYKTELMAQSIAEGISFAALITNTNKARVNFLIALRMMVLELAAPQQHLLANMLMSIKKLVPNTMSLEGVHSMVMMMHREMEYAVAIVENEEAEQEIIHQIEEQTQEQVMAEAQALLSEQRQDDETL